METLVDRLALVSDRIQQACSRSGRRTEDINLIAVTKTVGPEILPDLAHNGLVHAGENRVDHLEMMAAAAPAPMHFHFIGRVQSRQFRRIVPLVSSIHSLAEPHHVAKLARIAHECDRVMPVFCQVNLGNDTQKAGQGAEMAKAMVEEISDQKSLILQGLMTMAPNRDAPDVSDDQIADLFGRTASLNAQLGCSRLSMGMSKDFDLAIEAGATDIRLGSILVNPL